MSIVYTAGQMDSSHLKTEMILSSLMPMACFLDTYWVRATDGTLEYTYTTTQHGSTLTSRVVSLREPATKLRVIAMSENLDIDKERVGNLLPYIEFL